MVHIFAHDDRAYGIPKIYISYGTLYSVIPTIDTTSSFLYSIDKYLKSVITPLTDNKYSVKDTFQAVNRIQSFPSELFDQNYHYCW